MNIEINRINTAIYDDTPKFIYEADIAYRYQLEKIADEIVKAKNERPVILLSGPSGSGKTTTALMIEKLLNEKGCPTHTLSMDNYFNSLTEEQKKLAALGKMDLESPERMNKTLLNEQIEAIGKCEEVELPRYNFATSTSEKSGKIFKRRAGELVIFEGIHALNPSVITVPDEKIWKLYVSVRTRITCDDLILHPSKIRLLRRMLRDKKFRDRSFIETMNMFEGVESGENKYIMPYKHRSDYDIDTFIAYELNVYREFLLENLHELSDIPELADVTRVLENTEPIGSDDVPKTSLIREFIG